MRRRIVLSLLGVGLALVFAARVSSQGDPWWDPRNPYGQSYGITIGQQRPAFPADGLVMVLVAPGVAPQLQIYRATTGTWAGIGIGVAGGTPDVVPVWNAAGTDIEDSTITDNGLDVVATAGLITSGPAVGAANSILIDGNNAAIVFEGAADAFEVQIMVESPTADLIFDLPDYSTGAAVVSAFVSTGRVVPQAISAVWAEDDAIVFEGPTANAFENRLETVDVGQLQAVAIPDIGEGEGSFVVSLADAGAGDVNDANAVWVAGGGAAGELWFEGATADANHVRIYPVDPLAGEGIFALPNGGAETWAFLVTEAEGNVRGAANGIWGEIGSLVWEGTGADAFEFRISADFVGVDTILEANAPAAGGSGNLLRLWADLTAVPMDNNDIVAGLDIAITNANHAGANNVLNGIRIESIVGDPQATESALYFGGTGWNYQIESDNWMVINVPNNVGYTFSGATVVHLTIHNGPFSSAVSQEVLNVGEGATLFAMNGSDVKYGTLVSLVNADHAGASNYLYGMGVASIVEDAEAYEGALFLDNGWDAHFVLNSTAAAPAENPPAGSVAFILDDNVDYSGGGGNDCCLIARTSGGATVIVATIVLNGACP